MCDSIKYLYYQRAQSSLNVETKTSFSVFFFSQPRSLFQVPVKNIIDQVYAINISWFRDLPPYTFEITEPGYSNCSAVGSVLIRSFVEVRSVVLDCLVVQLLSLLSCDPLLRNPYVYHSQIFHWLQHVPVQG